MRQLVLAAGLLAACGDNHIPDLPWGIGVRTFDATALGAGAAAPPAPWIAALVPTPVIETPTYDGANQATHPDLLVEPTPGGGVRTILAITPYPYSDDQFENPSLLDGSDGITFAPLAGAPSPLVPPPPYDHNDDPDLRRDPRTGTYELLYLETLRPDRQTLVALRSPDLIAWTRHDAIVYDLAGGDPFIVSPAAIVDGAGATRLFVVELGDPNRVMELTSADGMTWDKQTAVPISLELGDLLPWHVDVIDAGPGTYAMLISAYPRDGAFAHQDLYVAISHDLDHWQLVPQPLLAYDDPRLGTSTLYRSTGVVSGDTLAVWYSMQYYPIAR